MSKRLRVMVKIKAYQAEHNDALPTNLFLPKEAKPNPAIKLRNYVGGMMAKWIPTVEKKAKS